MKIIAMYELAKDKVTCLGIADAGWARLISYHKKLNHTVYHAYQFYHPAEIDLPGPNRFNQILETSSNQESIYLKYVNKFNLMRNVANQSFLIMDDNYKTEVLIYALKVMMELNINTSGIQQNELLSMIEGLSRDKNKNLAKCLEELISKVFPNILQEQYTIYQDFIIKRISEQFKDFFTVAIITMYSKGLIATTLQANIERAAKGEPLIPIEMIFMMEDQRDSKEFTGDFQKAKDKLGFYFTNQELRLIYRLMHEIPDEHIKNIMKETFFLKKLLIGKDGTETFIPIPNPWDVSDEARLEWEARPKNKSPEKVIPPWMTELIEFSQNPSEYATRARNKVNLPKIESIQYPKILSSEYEHARTLSRLQKSHKNTRLR